MSRFTHKYFSGKSLLMTASQAYFDKTLQLLNHVRETQTPAIERASEICADSIADGGLVFLFGNGHSRMMCEEMTPRQGCFPGFVALVELALSNHAAIVGANGLRAPLHLEKYEGYAEEILKGFKFGPRDAFVVITKSLRRTKARTASAPLNRISAPIRRMSLKASVKATPAAWKAWS